MKKPILLIPAHPADRCYLIEVLYWRAFGRLPKEEWYDENELWRFSSEVRDSYGAPFLQGLELEDEECSFAELPPDPRMAALFDGTPSIPIDQLKKMIKDAEAWDTRDPEIERSLRDDITASINYHNKLDEWQVLLDEYLDEFKAEIALDLKRGKISAKGTELPAPTFEACEAILEKREIGLNDLDVTQIPKSAWVSQAIDWEESAINGRNQSYIWIHISVSEMLDLYPPTVMIDSSKAYPIGSSVAVVGGSNISSSNRSNRGRPPLPWDKFHVEVARLYSEGQMPEKKEAAIALLVDWFEKSQKKKASRSVVGARLKPYFDKIGRK